MPTWLIAGFWGAFAGGALLVGAAIGYQERLSQRFVAAIMAFGSGVLIAAVSFELMTDAYRLAGVGPTTLGFFGGAVIYSLANTLLAGIGGKHRKRSQGRPGEDDAGSSGMAIAVGALLDGVPESVAIGLTMLTGGGVSIATVASIFVSNIPEGLSSSAGMKKGGRSASFVFGIWLGITVASGLAALAGYAVFGNFSAPVQAATTAVAAGGILSMLAETMMPEAYEGTHNWAGIITCAGFVCSAVLSILGG